MKNKLEKTLILSQMSIDAARLGFLGYLFIYVVSAVIGCYVSAYIGINLFIVMHIAYCLYNGEQLSKVIWFLSVLSLIIPGLLFLISKSYPQFYKAMKGFHFGLFPNFDSIYLIYGGALFSILCVAFIYQRTSFYNTPWNKGGGGFFIMAGFDALAVILCYYSLFKLLFK